MLACSPGLPFCFLQAFAGALQLFALTASLGSTESLVMAPSMMSSRDLTKEQARNAGITEGTVRLSIGLEDMDDLTEDVNQALAASSPSLAITVRYAP